MNDLGNSILDARIKDSELSNKEKDNLNKDLIESNDRLDNFIEIYNDITNKNQDNKINTLNDAIKNKNLTSDEKNELQNKIKELETQKKLLIVNFVVQ